MMPEDALLRVGPSNVRTLAMSRRDQGNSHTLR